MKQKIHNSIIIVLALILVLYAFLGIRAASNDDPVMMNVISGYQSGEPGVLVYLMSLPYTWVISRLYMLTTSVPWYGLAYVVINTSSVLVIARAFLQGRHERLRFVATIAILLGLYLYNLITIEFTTVAGFASAAAVMLIYELGPIS